RRNAGDNFSVALRGAKRLQNCRSQRPTGGTGGLGGSGSGGGMGDGGGAGRGGDGFGFGAGFSAITENVRRLNRTSNLKHQKSLHPFPIDVKHARETAYELLILLKFEGAFRRNPLQLA